MYGLVVKTSFGVWRLSLMSSHFRVGRHIVFAMVICLSVRMSVRHKIVLCPLCNLKAVQEILTNIR